MGLDLRGTWTAVPRGCETRLGNLIDYDQGLPATFLAAGARA